MLLREQLLHDVNSITDLQLLHQLFEYVQVVKRTAGRAAPNRDAILRFADTLTDAETAELHRSLHQEFGQVEVNNIT